MAADTKKTIARQAFYAGWTTAREKEMTLVELASADAAFEEFWAKVSVK